MPTESTVVTDSLRKGTEVSLSPRILKIWQELQDQFLSEVRWHPDVPHDILWENFNSSIGNGRCYGDGKVVERMAAIIAAIFAPTRPTHILGIGDSGSPLAGDVHGYLIGKVGPEQPHREFIRSYTGPPLAENGVVVTSSSQSGEGKPNYMIPHLEEGSNVLLVDSAVGDGILAKACVNGILSQPGVRIAGFATGVSINPGGWVQELNSLSRVGNPPFPLFSVVQVSGISYPDGDRSGYIKLAETRKALKIR